MRHWNAMPDFARIQKGAVRPSILQRQPSVADALGNDRKAVRIQLVVRFPLIYEFIRQFVLILFNDLVTFNVAYVGTVLLPFRLVE